MKAKIRCIFCVLGAVLSCAAVAFGRETVKRPQAPLYEYDLDNGLHVIISPDTTSPIVNVGMMYHVGSKNEPSDRTGFAHLFEHLLFHGTGNIPEGQMEVYMAAAGGYSNASTSADRTFYYTILPTHQYKLGLWIESERMLHPIISQSGLDREREVVKEESRQRYDTTPLGRAPQYMQAFEYGDYVYGWPVIGSMEHLNAASLEDVTRFFKTYYVPGNACLVVTGDVDPDDCMTYVHAYFDRIPAGNPVVQPPLFEPVAPGSGLREMQIEGLSQPHMFISYATLPETSHDALITDLLVSYLVMDTDSPLERLKSELPGISRITATPEQYELAGSIWIRASLADSLDYRVVAEAVQREMDRIAAHGISADDLSRMRISYQSGYVDMYYDANFLGEMLAFNYLERGDASRVNRLLDEYDGITNEDIQRVVKKYFTVDNRKILLLNPKKTE